MVRTLVVPARDAATVSLNEVITVDKTGYYVFAMLNCNEYLIGITADGDVVWKSENGYLPATHQGIMGMFVAIVFCYACYLALYAKAMKR